MQTRHLVFGVTYLQVDRAISDQVLIVLLKAWHLGAQHLYQLAELLYKI